jgi:hypothetical protein
MRYFYRPESDAEGDLDLPWMLVRITLTLLFGGMLVLGWRLLAQGRTMPQLPRRRRTLLNIEEAVRWRPEF